MTLMLLTCDCNIHPATFPPSMDCIVIRAGEKYPCLRWTRPGKQFCAGVEQRVVPDAWIWLQLDTPDAGP